MEIKTITTDVLIIGSGGAGCRAAIEVSNQGKEALIATDFADEKVTVKEDVSESEYQKSLLNMYYGTPNRKKQEVTEEVIVNVPINESENKEVTDDTPKQKIQKPRFLDRFIKTLGDVVEKIE